MNRHYFISNDLNDLGLVEKELEQRGVSMPQIHVLTQDAAGADKRNLHQVPSVVNNSVINTTIKAAVYGVAAAVLVLLVAYFTGVTESIGWVPFVFLAIIVLGFVTWEGGMWGIQQPNEQFRRFEDALKSGRHVLYVEVGQGSKDEVALQEVAKNHPGLEQAGVEDASTALLIGAENLALRFARWGP